MQRKLLGLTELYLAQRRRDAESRSSLRLCVSARVGFGCGRRPRCVVRVPRLRGGRISRLSILGKWRRVLDINYCSFCWGQLGGQKKEVRGSQ